MFVWGTYQKFLSSGALSLNGLKFVSLWLNSLPLGTPSLESASLALATCMVVRMDVARSGVGVGVA